MRNEIEKQILEQYICIENELEFLIENFRTFVLERYKEMHKYSVISFIRLMNYGNKLKSIEILPGKDEYIDQYRSSEFFDVMISFKIKNKVDYLDIGFGIPINISKLSSCIKEKNYEAVELEVSELKHLLHPDTIKEFEDYKKSKKSLKHYEKFKEENPIIVMNYGDIVRTNILNGNHRIIQAVKDDCKFVKGYVVKPDICRNYAMTEGYNQLYRLTEVLFKKLNGTERWYLDY